MRLAIRSNDMGCELAVYLYLQRHIGTFLVQ